MSNTAPSTRNLTAPPPPPNQRWLGSSIHMDGLVLTQWNYCSLALSHPNGHHQNSLWLLDAMLCCWSGSTLDQPKACCRWHHSINRYNGDFSSIGTLGLGVLHSVIIPFFFRIIKALVTCTIPRSCLTGVTATELQWLLINMKVTPGGGTPYVMGDTYVPRFWPPFFTLAGSSTIFLRYFSHPPTAKLSFGVQKLPIFTKIDFFGPKFNFSLDLFGSNFQRPAAHPHQFSGRVPPPGGDLKYLTYTFH